MQKPAILPFIENCDCGIDGLHIQNAASSGCMPPVTVMAAAVCLFPTNRRPRILRFVSNANQLTTSLSRDLNDRYM